MNYQPPSFFSRTCVALGLLAVTAFSGIAGCATFAPLDPAKAKSTLIPYEGNCAGDAIRVWDKRGRKLLDPDRENKDTFAVCAVTDTYIEPCCPQDGMWSHRCANPRRFAFKDMSRLEHIPPPPLRCMSGFSI